MMTTIFLFIQVSLFGIIQIPEKMVQESLLIKHNCKIIDHGYFVFCSIDENNMIVETTFSYSINLKKQKFTVLLIGSDSTSLKVKDKSYLSEFSNSEGWNQKRVGSSVEKYFLVFHPDFLKWNNFEKLSFFLRVCKNK